MSDWSYETKINVSMLQSQYEGTRVQSGTVSTLDYVLSNMEINPSETLCNLSRSDHSPV